MMMEGSKADLGCEIFAAADESGILTKEGGGREEENKAEQVVTPWEVVGKGGAHIDYEKLILQFGCQRLDSALVERVEKLTGRPARPFLRRGVFFAHREFNLILDAYEKGEKFYLYTGRGPSWRQ